MHPKRPFSTIPVRRTRKKKAKSEAALPPNAPEAAESAAALPPNVPKTRAVGRPGELFSSSPALRRVPLNRSGPLEPAGGGFKLTNAPRTADSDAAQPPNAPKTTESEGFGDDLGVIFRVFFVDMPIGRDPTSI